MTKLGIDLGSSSLGWAIRNENQITNKGVVTFSTGMSKGQSGGYTSPTRDRREARSKRNLIKARKYRKWALLKVLSNNKEFTPISIIELEKWSKYKKDVERKFPENEKFLKWLACDFSYEDGIKYSNPYELRVKALEEKLSKHELGRVLYHLVQRRGYKDIGESNSETETQIKRRGESGFQKALETHGSISKALKLEFLDKGKRARNEYPYREEYQKELELICKAQGYDITKEGKDGYNDPYILSLWKAIIWQRPLRSQKGNVGKCTIEPSKRRCPTSHPIFEISRAWQFINTIKFYNEKEEKEPLSQEVRYELFIELFMKRDSFKFEDVRKFLDKKLKSKLVYNYPINQKTGKYETPVSGMPFCNGIIKILGQKALESIKKLEKYRIGDCPKLFNGYSMYDIWHSIFSFDDDYLEKFAKNQLQIEDIQVTRNKKEVKLSPLNILKGKLDKGYGDLSIKVLKKIIPFLKQGYLYNEAVVLAKLPEILGEKWQDKENDVIGSLNKARNKYSRNKLIVGISNNLIDAYKGEVEAWRTEGTLVRAYKEFDYLLNEVDNRDIEKACSSYFGEESWKKRIDKDAIISEVGKEYQEFFFDSKRGYRKVTTLDELFESNLKEKGIELKDKLYHHSQRKNIYGSAIEDKDTGKKILPIPLIDSIKNPMFNKSMSILRRLINELIKKGEIDEETEVVVELARELNDNNKRAAIERYQNEKRRDREKVREFLEEFKITEGKSFDVNEKIRDFELWNEQLFEKTDHSSGQKRKEILSEKTAIKRYELWMEQKGQCMYTGKMISVTQLFSNEIDIEHTIPRSILPDNTKANLTVCYAKYNRDEKGKLMPFYCKNFENNIEGIGTAIKPRLEPWKKIRDNYKFLYKSRLKPSGSEDEDKKNNRIQEKHYFKMHFDYWNDKVQRFTTDEIKDSWARRQLVDTQMVSKYAREFLRTYFRKVAVQKGSVTAEFRKIYGFQEVDEIKSRNKHTHHAIDAAVLTLIPVNSSLRDSLLNEMYKLYETKKVQLIRKPYNSFDSQNLISEIENEILIVNYVKDKLLLQTTKNIRKSGKLQYVTNNNGEFILDKQGSRKLKKAKGDTIRSTLYKQTFLGKIRDVQRYSDGQPVRENGEWKYKTGDEEYIFTERKALKDVLSKTDDIIDPVIRKIIKEQKEKAVDPQGNRIRHVRIKCKAGKVVKERVDYRSKHEHKNYFYSAAGSIPYALMLQKSTKGNVERKLLPIASFEVAKIYKQFKRFTPELFLDVFHPELNDYQDLKLLKLGQKLLVLNEDEEFDKVKCKDFQRNRLYRITQFGDSTIYLKYHITSTKDEDIDKSIKMKKDEVLSVYDRKFGLGEIDEDLTISDASERKKKYEDERFRFVGLKDFRFKRLLDFMDIEDLNQLRKELSRFKKQSSSIEVEGETPLLKLNKEEGWNFIYENYDFNIDISGNLNFIKI